jgi:protein-tyrosine phosphatase
VVLYYLLNTVELARSARLRPHYTRPKEAGVPEPRSTHHRSLAVLFICLGNICRSPMAESVLRKQVEQAGLRSVINVDSAGTGAWHVGEPPDHRTLQVLQRHGMASAHRARVVTQADFTRFDYVIAMDRSNLRELRSMGAGSAAHLALLLSYAPALGVAEVPDPYYSGAFDDVYTLVDEGCRGLLSHMITAHRLEPRSHALS